MQRPITRLLTGPTFGRPNASNLKCIALLFMILFCGCSSCSATKLQHGSAQDFDWILVHFDPSIRSLLESQPWVYQPKRQTEPLLEAISDLDSAYETKEGIHATTEIATLFAVLSSSPAYNHGQLNEEEFTLIDSLFRSLTSVYRLDTNFDWLSLFTSSLADGDYSWSSKGTAFFIAATDHTNAQSLLKIITDNFESVQDFLGPYKRGFIVVVALPRSNMCITLNDAPVILLNASCMYAPIVLHEVVHAFTPTEVPDWYDEGIAEYVSGLITDTLQQKYNEAQQFFYQANASIKFDPEFHSTSKDLLSEASGQARFGGFMFLKDIGDILGPGMISKVAKAVRPGSSGENIINAFVAASPAESSVAVERLITKYMGSPH